MHRKSVTADAVVRSWAEKLQSPTVDYVPCAPTTQSTYLPAAASVNVLIPQKFTAQIKTIEYWDGNQTAGYTNACAAATDKGVERITLVVASNDRRGAQRVQILKRKP